MERGEVSGKHTVCAGAGLGPGEEGGVPPAQGSHMVPAGGYPQLLALTAASPEHLLSLSMEGGLVPPGASWSPLWAPGPQLNEPSDRPVILGPLTIPCSPCS